VACAIYIPEQVRHSLLAVLMLLGSKGFFEGMVAIASDLRGLTFGEPGRPCYLVLNVTEFDTTKILTRLGLTPSEFVSSSELVVVEVKSILGSYKVSYAGRKLYNVN